jgi:carboxymethylenebutenolidase
VGTFRALFQEERFTHGAQHRVGKAVGRVVAGRPGGAGTRGGQADAAESKPADGFEVQDKFIKVERFEPAAPGRHPAVVVVHGADGLQASGELYRREARELARRGYAVFLVHYFDRTGHSEVSPKKIKKEDFQAWHETVHEAVRYAAGQPGVDKKWIGLVGFSLGAYLALAVAAEPDCPVAAVVGLFGGLPKELHERVKTLPPVLIVHGDKDEVVPLAEAHKLRDLMAARRLTLEVEIYKGVDHVFTGPGGKFQLLDALHARERASRFLDTHLRGRGDRE